MWKNTYISFGQVISKMREHMRLGSSILLIHMRK